MSLLNDQDTIEQQTVEKKKNVVYFNKEFLDKLIERDKAVVIGKYEKYTRETRVKFTCGTESCNKIGEKTIRMCHKIGMFCDSCTLRMKQEKTSKTNFAQTGFTNPFLNPSVQKAIKDYHKLKYGSDHLLQNKEIMDKLKATNMRLRGVENTFQDPEVQKKIKATNMRVLGAEHPAQNKEIMAKMKATNMKIRGVENPLKDPEVQQKIKDANIRLYGSEHPAQNKEIMEKMKATNMKIRGVECSLKDPEVQKKIKDTNIRLYGSEYPAQNSKVAEKALKSSYKRKEVVSPSGNLLLMQGYEPFAYKILLDSYKEDEIYNSPTQVPKIWWKDSNDKDHRYFCDFYIPKDNLIIEIKSTRTYELANTEGKIKKTVEAATAKGYNMQIWIISDKGDIIEKYSYCAKE